MGGGTLPAAFDDSSPATRKPWRAMLAAAAVVAVAGTGITVLATRQSKSAGADRVPVALATAVVKQQDIELYDETTATLEFTESQTVAAPSAGTVTSVVAEGQTVDAGTVVATIDGSPLVALIGDVPGYRDLSTSSSDGIDIRELETNIVSLGFDPTGAIAIDESYDKATAAAVKRWQASLGLTEDGKVPKSLVTYVPGTMLVDSVDAAVGSSVSAGSTLLSGRQTARSFPVVAVTGTGAVASKFAAAGTKVETGTPLFWNGLYPVVAILGDSSAEPMLSRDLELGVSDGADVKLLETMLRAGGYDADNAMTIDDAFDSATVAAVLRWQTALGVPYVDPNATDAIVPRGSFVVVPSGLEMGTPRVTDGAALLADTDVVDLTAPARVVSTTAPLGSTTFAVGATMEVEFPDASTATGTVTSVGTTATNAGNTPGATPSVPITIQVDTIPDSAASFVSIPVTLRVVTTSVPGALVVPVSALVALAEGGYAVETVTGKAADGSNETKLVGVTAGVFSDGFVQVTGDGLAAGQQVVVPS